MHPTVEFLGRTIPTYGIMAAAGLICGLLFVFLYSRKLKLDAEAAAYIYTFGFLGCGVGAKLLYIAVTFRQIIADIKALGWFPALMAHLQGGLVFYGGLLGAIAAAFITARYLKCDITRYYPALVPGIAIMAGFGRIGCFFAGCCYGRDGIPVQLYEAAFEFVMVFVLVILSRAKPSVAPRLLSLYCALYATFRFCLEFYRADEGRGIYGPFSTSQWISIAIIIVTAVNEVLNKRGKQEKKPPAMV